MEVKLVPMDGEAFEVEAKVAAMSLLVRTKMADGVHEIPLPNVKGAVLAKVVEFCEHHKDAPMAEIQKPLKSNVLSDWVDEWDANFANELDPKLLFELTQTAMDMGIQGLLDLLCAKAATMIKGRTPEEVRAALGLVDEFTEDEKRKLK